MTTRNHHRGNELPDHRNAKLGIRQMLMEAGFDMVFFEYKNADVVAMRRGQTTLFVVAVEVERTVRNVLENIRRDLRSGCDCVVVACLVKEVADAATRLIVRKLPQKMQGKIRVVPLEALCASFLWDLGQVHEVDSGFVQVRSAFDSGGLGDRSP